MTTKKVKAQKLWSKADLKKFKKIYPIMPTIEVANKMVRTIRACEHKASRLKLRKVYTEPETVDDMVKAEKIRMDKTSQSKMINQLVKKRAEMEVVVDILNDITPMIDFKPKVLKKQLLSDDHEEVVILNIGDAHFGRYVTDRMQEKVNELYKAVTKVVAIHRSAYKVKTLVINMLGDLVDGEGIYSSQSHEQKFYLMEQMYRYGSPMICNLLNQLSNEFEEIIINTIPGNHGRSGTSRTNNPNVELNYDTIMYEQMKAMTAGNPRISWNITWDWYQVVEVLGWNFMLHHGDKIRSWMNIPFYGIINKGMRWKGSLPEEWDFMFMGHFHTTHELKWNDFRIYGSGTWLDNDKFALGELGMDSATEQSMFGVSKKRGITWKYNIDMTNGRKVRK